MNFVEHWRGKKIRNKIKLNKIKDALTNYVKVDDQMLALVYVRSTRITLPKTLCIQIPFYYFTGATSYQSIFDRASNLIGVLKNRHVFVETLKVLRYVDSMHFSSESKWREKIQTQQQPFIQRIFGAKTQIPGIMVLSRSFIFLFVRCSLGVIKDAASMHLSSSRLALYWRFLPKKCPLEYFYFFSRHFLASFVEVMNFKA